jgi:hypothetical protein
MPEVDVNYMAVLAATIVSFVIGFVWYRPLFGKPWISTLGLSPEILVNSLKPEMRRAVLISFPLQYVMAFCLALFIGNGKTIGTATLYGLVVGVVWIAFAISITAMYEQKSFKYMLINGGYWTVSFTMMGLIIGAWQ